MAMLKRILINFTRNLIFLSLICPKPERDHFLNMQGQRRKNKLTLSNNQANSTKLFPVLVPICLKAQLSN